MWSAHEPTGSYWDHAAGLPETTITITTTLGPARKGGGYPGHSPVSRQVPCQMQAP